MSVYFTSDLHLRHKFLADKRGFSSVREHDEHVLASLEKVLNKRDVLWVLGDVFWKDDLIIEEFGSLPGRKKLVLGNHDVLDASRYLKVFESLHGAMDKYDYFLTHIPIHPQEMYRKKMNIHGHIHKGGGTNLLEDKRYLCVNWDFYGEPISLDYIRTL